jgi:NAD(P)-dependent dehydrogenase (short-subunit alcohol dehydrogenase family)
MDIGNLTILITGGGSGLGAATANLLAKKGAKVAVMDTNHAAAAAIADQIGGFAVAGDVTDAASAQNAIDAASFALGKLRVLINCAGIGGSHRVVGKNGPYPLDAFTKVIQVNLIGSFNMLRLFAAQAIGMEKLGEERGLVINTASIAAFDGQIGQAAYAASKAGVAGMTLPLARDLAQHAVRVMSIAPGPFLTPMMQTVSEDIRQNLAAQIPFPPRLGNPTEFAALAAHIIENPMLNGETIRLDGAVRMPPR